MSRRAPRKMLTGFEIWASHLLAILGRLLWRNTRLLRPRPRLARVRLTPHQR